MKHSTAAILAISTLFVDSGATPTMAQTWEARNSERGAEAFVQNKARKSALVVKCARPPSISLELHKPVSWRANQSISLRVGGRSFSLEIEGHDDWIGLSNISGIGISSELIEAMKGGGALLLEGAATQRMSTADRTFPLTNAAKALDVVERACGR